MFEIKGMMKHCRRIWAMKEMETFVKAFGEGLRSLAQGVHAIADKLDSYVIRRGVTGISNPNLPRMITTNPRQQKKLRITRFSQKKPAITATAVVHEAIITATNPLQWMN